MMLAAVLISLLQDVLEVVQHKCLSPKGLSFQSLLMNIYGTESRKNSVYSNSLDPCGLELTEKTGQTLHYNFTFYISIRISDLHRM